MRCMAAVSCAGASRARDGLCAGGPRQSRPTVGSGRAVTAAGAVSLIPARAWHRMRTGSGTKGTRHYDWAMLEVTSDDTPGGHDGGHSALRRGGRQHRGERFAQAAEFLAAVAGRRRRESRSDVAAEPFPRQVKDLPRGQRPALPVACSPAHRPGSRSASHCGRSCPAP